MSIAFPKSTLSLDQFRSAFLAGGLRSISVRAAGGRFLVTALPRTGQPISLATTHGKKLRTFRNPLQAIQVLHEMGARKLEVDTSEWSPEQAKLGGVKRPDTAARQRRAQEAVAHDAWFRREIEAALLEAEDPKAPWDSETEVKRKSAAKQAEWLVRAKLDAKD